MRRETDDATITVNRAAAGPTTRRARGSKAGDGLAKNDSDFPLPNGAAPDAGPMQ